MKRKEIEYRLQIALGPLTALSILEVLYPNKYGKGKGDAVKIRRPA